ncbi:MAG: ATP synthase F1 subunit delta [Apibacter sp.]|jgi:F-type H+-transporting ATPase subunit delta|uniref:ATP synthase subunit delta n=1 Tax=Apibacter mensalis TaxID=1586267 RepID=A0A0X3AQY9_9FLAO|nr:ATP synthase F1 subunit delta [Apibacter mensalis]MCO6565473.1 ATP synthase F1 subunit delta [Apibacter sp.]CVK16527.1 F-type H+-transporting ATPase subunit delta [Apibacter mensalis]
MSVVRLAKRYASGLWEYALSVHESETIIKEMKSLIDIIKQNKDFQFFLKSPIIETLKKVKIVNEIFKSFSPISRNFITLVVKHKRENDLLEIAEQVLELYDVYNGIQRVEIISAIPLDQETTNKILNSYPKINQDKAIIENKIDGSIIGGYILRMDDQQIDASVKSELTNIQKKLSNKIF